MLPHCWCSSSMVILKTSWYPKIVFIRKGSKPQVFLQSVPATAQGLKNSCELKCQVSSLAQTWRAVSWLSDAFFSLSESIVKVCQNVFVSVNISGIFGSGSAAGLLGFDGQRCGVQVDHHYVGGYYGAASEEEMKRELVAWFSLVSFKCITGVPQVYPIENVTGVVILFVNIRVSIRVRGFGHWAHISETWPKVEDGPLVVSFEPQMLSWKVECCHQKLWI